MWYLTGSVCHAQDGPMMNDRVRGQLHRVWKICPRSRQLRSCIEGSRARTWTHSRGCLHTQKRYNARHSGGREVMGQAPSRCQSSLQSLCSRDLATVKDMSTHLHGRWEMGMDIRDPEPGGQGSFGGHLGNPHCAGSLLDAADAHGQTQEVCSGLSTENDCLGSLEPFSLVL